ncbi:uncharacterized protein LOC115620994 [Scaptodrosophila lebanonensis]|uniref:glutamyl aminopeptidase n=1 Tax=Drosophila lebanonensis TaxID=7225 RepID=A0A6J2T327_DROLE|nr:uncharacterized protein LOC115620994 [Scaptodrosophila lebanonensis]
MIITAKVVAIGLGLALTAFTISTIVLAVQKADLKDELREVKEKLDLLEQEQGQGQATTPPSIPEETSSTVTTPTPETPVEIDYRLPDTLTPINYDLYLHPNIETENFSGEETITIAVNKSTDKIILHSLNLEILDISATYTDDGNNIPIKGKSLDSVREFLIIELTEDLIPDRNIKLVLSFEGSMGGKIVGLYSSSYLKADGVEKKRIATSKFEPTYARQAFPCFDEPALKATFEITLVHPQSGDYHSLSNMDIATTKIVGDYNEVYFTKSVPMSTYLACFIVSDFAKKTVDIDTNGIGESFIMSVYATPEQIDKVDFALDVGKGVIEYYINYFQIEYPLPKLDMAAIPDFVSGAMEHWGLVTYRETSLLYEQQSSSTANKQRIASVIAHEFAHMWFGNLVTMHWWNDLWLNEGFASFIEYLGVNAVFPEWQMRDQFIVSTLHGVLTLDATLGSHPIVQTVTTPDQITEIFDTITYSKGSSLIRMLEGFLGEPDFRRAVTNYLNEYKYQNAVTDNFLAEIDKLGLEFNVTDIMLTWTMQMGLPVVNVEQISNTEYKLTQKRFLSNPNDYDVEHEASPFNYRWTIPITYTTSLNEAVTLDWFSYDQNEIIISVPQEVQWIKFNHDQVGYYRVNYQETLWESLAERLESSPDTFTSGDRASLLNDAFALADSTQLPYDVALDMTRYLKEEQDYVPWSVAASKLTSLKRTLYYTNSYVKYKKYATALIDPIYTALGWTVGEDHLNNRLRVTALSAACSLGLESCLTEVGVQFNSWLATPNERPNPDVREIVYYYGMLSVGNQEIWEAVWKLFIAETDASEKSKLMYGLAAVQEPWLLQRYIDEAWNEENVRGQDYFTCLTYIAANPVGEPLVWDHVRENWTKLVERFGLNERYLGNLIPSITARFNTQTKLEEMESFFAKYPEAGAGTAARVRALETVKNNIVWLAENLESVDAWLEKHCTREFKEVVCSSPLKLNKRILRKTLSKECKEMNLKDFYFALTIFCTLINVHAGGSLTTNDNERKIDYRLPRTLTPLSYKIYLHPDLERGHFSGQEEIKVQVNQPTKQIILHAYELNITSVVVEIAGTFPALEVANYELDVVREMLIIDMVEKLPLKKIIVSIMFNQKMLNKLEGLYTSTYYTPANEPRTIATTKFEPSHARQAFPCFDEPAFKATFTISVLHPTDSYHALSNMNQVNSINFGENTKTVFEASVPMSTYLACIIVSDFQSKSKNVNAKGIGHDFTMRAFATPHQVDKVQFALDFGVAVTEYYIQYYQIPYPLPKLDMAAIPDFASGAMEHWGLVTYRETALLYDENYSSTANKQSVAGTLAHEIAHMWFGNLVTMKWWNDIWLNEGFARYMQYKGVHAVYPEWDMLTQFQITVLHSVLNFDAKLSSHPIVQPVETPSQINAIFNTISYDKGASVIRMLEDLVGAEIFEEAVINYLKKYQFSNAETDDFLSEVAALVSSFDVKVFMRTWTEQMGYPVVEVERLDDTRYLVTQKRFLSNKNSYDKVPDDSEFGYKWSIPLTYVTDTEFVPQYHFYEYNSAPITLTTSSPSQWIKLNTHQVGYYRVNYEESLWKKLIEELIYNPTSFDTADRANLLNDAFALADADQLPYKIALDLSAYLPQERDFVPWHVATEALKKLHRHLKKRESFSNYARDLLQNVYMDVGWTVDTDNHLRNRLRVTALRTACSLRLEFCLTDVSEQFYNWLGDTKERPHPDLREIVYYNGMVSVGNEDIWEKVWQLYLDETDASEKAKLMVGLAAIQDPKVLQRYIDAAWIEKNVRGQDYFTCLKSIAANPVGEPLVWNYVRKNWTKLVERFGLRSSGLGKLISSITARFSTRSKLQEIERFFRKYPVGGAGKAERARTLEQVKNNIAWLRANLKSVVSWLENRQR